MALALAGVLLAVGVVLWKPWRAGQKQVAESSRQTNQPAASAPDMREPAEDFATFQYVLETGGCDITRSAALAYLDRHVRDQQPLPQEECARVMAMIEQGGNPSWTEGYRQHLFNSAFNAMHYGNSGVPYIRQLERLALNDPDLTMRLYALQHLGMMRRIGQLNGDLAAQIRATVETMARQQDSQVSGTAIQLLADWDGSQSDKPLSTDVAQLALATAADEKRSVDIRVTAIHAAGPAALTLARSVAKNAREPVMLRKAAIARIGEDGGPEDLDQLASLSREGSRIAQATQPAIDAIRGRMTDTRPVKLVPYQ